MVSVSELSHGASHATAENRSDELLRLREENANKMDQLFRAYFGLDPSNRYLGSHPGTDRETGAPRAMWALSLNSHATRNAIVASLRAAVAKAGLDDVTILRSGDSPEFADAYGTLRPARMEIVATGTSITDAMAGERRIRDLLDSLDAWFTNA